MHNLRYFMARVLCKIKKDKDEEYSKLFRKEGCYIGKDCHIYSNIITPEPYLIHIGDDVTISDSVTLITHDNSVCKPLPEYTDLFGEIFIGDNCFIGSHAMILPGVKLAKGTIVAAGSVVTKSFLTEKIVIGGNPARQIGTWDEYIKKNEKYALNIDGLSLSEKKDLILQSGKLIKER